MERQAEQSALAAARDLVADVEERRRHERAVANDPDLAALLGDEQAAAAVVGVHDAEWRIEAAGDLGEADPQPGRVEPGRRRRGSGRGRARRTGVDGPSDDDTGVAEVPGEALPADLGDAAGPFGPVVPQLTSNETSAASATARGALRRRARASRTGHRGIVRLGRGSGSDAA